MGEPVSVWLGLGANQGDRAANLREAVRRLGECVTVERLSSLYETEPAYVADQPRFLNMVLRGTTSYSPRDLLRCLKTIEREMGRVAGLRYGPRPIDIDILLYGDELIDEPDLQVPHPRLRERAFVLQPLAELAPDLVPPGGSESASRLLAAMPAMGEVIACLGPLSPSSPSQSATDTP